jgi:uncharacterized protein
MDYKKVIIIIAVFLALAITGFIISLNLSKQPEATIKGKTFKLLVAKSEEDRQIGLSKYHRLPQDTGMIFIFDKPAIYSFWMKNMNFPIDILYINGDRIVTIYKNQKPESSGNPPVLNPKEEVDKVLEINAGLSDKYKIQEGDKVDFKNLDENSGN